MQTRGLGGWDEHCGDVGVIDPRHEDRSDGIHDYHSVLMRRQRRESIS